MNVLVTVVAIVLAIVLAIIGLGRLMKSQAAAQKVVRLADISRVFEQVAKTGSDGSFAVFMFSERGQPGQDSQVNVQFSMEKGKVGLDWVMLGPVNVRDKQRVFDFLQERGVKPERLSGNGVRYIRAEGGDLVELCQRLMTQLYGVGPDDEIDLVVEAFAWGR